MMSRRWMMLAALTFAVLGCDGKDPERLNRVGKKVVEKSQRLADDANVPQVTITRQNSATGSSSAKGEKSPAAKIK